MSRRAPRTATMAAVLVTLVVRSPAAGETGVTPGRIELEAGPAVLALDLPHGESQVRAAVAIGAALHVDPRVPIALHGRVVIGADSTSQRTLGISGRIAIGRVVVDTGLAATSVTGERSAIASALQPRGLGLAVAVRAGARLGPVTIAVFALPTWVFASDAPAREAALRSAATAGLAIGYAF